MNDDHLSAQEASAEAVHKARNAAQAAEVARAVQLEEAIRKTAAETKQALLEALIEVFGQGDEKRDPDQMTIMIRRIPLICQDVKQIHADISSINDNLKWGIRVVLGSVLLAIMGMILIHK